MRLIIKYPKNMIKNLKSGNTQQDVNENDSIESTNLEVLELPTIDKAVYDGLPVFIKECCKFAINDRQRDIMLLSTLTILSGSLRGISGFYRGKRYYSPLYSFILANAANDKGIMSEARLLGQKLHRTIRSKSESNFYDASSPDPKPVLYIPGSVSTVMMINHIHASLGYGIICETESDVLASSLRQKWGDFSHLLRQAFQHETVSHSTKSDEYTEIEQPKLATLLTGTPSMVKELINSAENGLFSRFLFYRINEKSKWQKDQYGDENLDEHYANLAEKVYEMAVHSNNYPTTFCLTKNQRVQLDKVLENLHNEIQATYGDGLTATIKRLGIICFRIAMILTEVKRCTTKCNASTQTCSDEIFNISLNVVTTLSTHATSVFKTLPNNTELNDRYASFLRILPTEFTRREAIELYKKNVSSEVSDRAIDQWLRDLSHEGKRILKNRHGKYKKVRHNT